MDGRMTINNKELMIINALKTQHSRLLKLYPSSKAIHISSHSQQKQKKENKSSKSYYLVTSPESQPRKHLAKNLPRLDQVNEAHPLISQMRRVAGPSARQMGSRRSKLLFQKANGWDRAAFADV